VLSSCWVSWSLCGPRFASDCCFCVLAPGKIVYRPRHRVGIFTGAPISASTTCNAAWLADVASKNPGRCEQSQWRLPPLPRLGPDRHTHH
jgi:hypothetical protein